MKFVRNTWYAAAWSEEITRALFSRKLLNEQVLLYRKEDGTPCAISDSCPHRFAPLSLGKLIGDEVECLYHGLRFDCTGKCVDNPNGAGVIPKAAFVKSYPLTERYGLVWIWMGDVEKADESLVPSFPWLTDSENFTQVHGTLNIEANYLLVMDNLTDLSHAAFIHVETLEPREMAKSTFEVSEEHGEVWTRQWSPAMVVPPLFTVAKGLTGLMDHWLEMRCIPRSAAMITFYGVTEVGKSREEGYGTFNPNIITPESDASTHYFWGSARDFDLDDVEMSEKIRAGATHAFTHEDKPMIEAQQRRIRDVDLMSLKPVLLVNDAGSVRARRAIERLIAQEQEQADKLIAVA